MFKLEVCTKSKICRTELINLFFQYFIFLDPQTNKKKLLYIFSKSNNQYKQCEATPKH